MNRHGFVATYNIGCRCIDCKVAAYWHQVRKIERMRARFSADPKSAPHGKNRAYTIWGCRCDECRKAHTAASRKYRAAKYLQDSRPNQEGTK